jgi:hypothetical protein
MQVCAARFAAAFPAENGCELNFFAPSDGPVSRHIVCGSCCSSWQLVMQCRVGRRWSANVGRSVVPGGRCAASRKKNVASRPAMTAQVFRSGATIASKHSTRKFGESEKRNSGNVSDKLLHSRVRFVTNNEIHGVMAHLERHGASRATKARKGGMTDFFLATRSVRPKMGWLGAWMRCRVLAAAKALRRPPSTMCRWRGREVCNTLKCNTAQPLRASTGLLRFGRATTSAN